ncbi:protein NPGR2 [Lactuca sativa]|uniref:protein NPGR2 n=1 Tax=Lactuca sativa TaxID=4236 RepID=UPI000CAD328C|nr:protein NPGR2 [Lactuca sativa]
MIESSDSQVTKYFSANPDSSSQAISEVDQKPDTRNIEEAESSLRESNSLNYEEARALLGRYEYQKGNIEAALHVFEGIDLAAATPKMKISLNELRKPQRHSSTYGAPPFSINTVGLLLEAAYLKSKSLQNFGRYKEAAESCKVVLDVIESSFPLGLPQNLGTDHKLQETLTNSVGLLPELYQLAESHQEAIISFRRALLHHWNLDKETTAKIQKQFAIFLLYSGSEEANPPNFRFQTDGSFIPKNNIEEAILILMILLRKVCLKKIEWDPDILDHLSYALSISGGFVSLGKQLEELLPGIIENNERCLLLALCYYAQNDCSSALNLIKIIQETDDRHIVLPLLIASKIHSESSNSTQGVRTSKRAIHLVKDKCEEMMGVAYSFLGVSLSVSSHSKSESESLQCLETAGRLTKMVDSQIVYLLGLESAEQRKLDVAFGYANRLIHLEGGSHVRGWMLLARILSAQKRFKDGESVINAALDQTVKWDQGELLRTKAKLQLARGQVKRAIQTYTQLLAVLQVQFKSFGFSKKNHDRKLELETWNDLAKVYIRLSQWQDAEACLMKSKAICNYSASTRHTTGLLYEAQGLNRQALKAYKHALDVDPGDVESLVSMAVVLRKVGGGAGAVGRGFLNEALRVDRMKSSVWYNLGLYLRDESPMEAADCFEAAGVLKETEPIEPFR